MTGREVSVSARLVVLVPSVLVPTAAIAADGAAWTCRAVAWMLEALLDAGSDHLILMPSEPSFHPRGGTHGA